jgi:type IV pilus assembly protein PilQ
MEYSRMNAGIKLQTGSWSGEKQMQSANGFGRWLVALLIVGLMMAEAVQATALTLDDISYASLPGDSVQVRLVLSGDAPQPGTFTIDNPARIALDLPDTSVGDTRKNQTIGVGIARGIQAVEAGNRTRVVINLVHMVPYRVQTEKNVIVVTLGEAGTTPMSTTVAVAAAEDKDAPKTLRGNQLKNIDFRRGESGEGRVLVDLSSANIVADINEEAGKIVVEFLATMLPEQLERRLNVVDFATPVSTIDTFVRGNNVRMEISASGRYQHLAYQTGEVLAIEIQPLSQAEEDALRKEKEQYTGEKLSLNFQNIEVRAVLQLLADFTGLNLVTSDTVRGDITLRLKNVPWDQALDIILKARGLGMRQAGNVVMIAPNEELAAREKLELEAQKQLRDLAPMFSDSIQVNYAKAADLANLLKSKENSLLSETGSITIDERTNKLLVKDTSENLVAIRKLVSELDIPVRQVLIESRIVLATDAFNKEMGVRFGVTKTPGHPPTGDATVTSGSLNATTEVLNGETIHAPDRYNVDLPVTNLASTAGTIGIALARLPLGTLVELELSAAQAEGKTEVVSSPRVITSNQQEAFIEQGVEIPYQQATSSGATNVSFKKAVLSLKVTPQITPDDRIIMDLEVKKDSPDYARSVLGQPPINKQQVTTQVLVDNGETIVLGGVYEQTKQNQVNRIPFFADLPLIGVLFRNNFNKDEKSELMIFVTPKILKDASAAR